MMKKKKLNSGKSFSIVEANHLFNTFIEKNPQFHELDLSKPYNVSPHISYRKTKLNKFIKYNEQDEFHVCKNDYQYDGNYQKCLCNTSEFRNIDKTRLIYTAIERTISLTNLMKYKLYEGIYILRNYEAFKSKFSFEYF
jgi:hypothetical protein